MDYASFILEALLDKYERSVLARGRESNRRIWLHFNSRTVPRYFDDRTARYKEEINAAALALEREGLIEIRWVKFEENNLIEKIALNTDRLKDAYARLKRRPKAEQQQELCRLAEHYARGAAEWAQEFFSTVRQRLEKGESQPYVDPADRERAEQLCKVIRELSLLQEEVPRRVFSLRVLGNSKAFDRLAAMAARVVRDFHPAWRGNVREKEAVLPVEEIKRVLAEVGVIDNPQHIFISGGLELAVDGRVLRVGDFFPDLGLPAEMVKRLTIKNITADYVITIENLTSFYQFVKTCRDRFLAVYLGGYHNAVRRLFLSKLREYLAAAGRVVPFYHWGDIDYGGFAIFVHLQKHCLPELQPLFMDVFTLERYRSLTSSFTSAYGRRLRYLLTEPDYRIFHPVIEKMLAEGIRLEQECVEPPVSLRE